MADLHILVGVSLSLLLKSLPPSNDFDLTNRRFIGALSNSGRRAANMTGFFKGLQSAGAAVWWRLDGTRRPYNLIFGSTWAMLVAGLVCAAPVLLLRIRDTTALDEDLRDTDEARGDALPVLLQDRDANRGAVDVDKNRAGTKDADNRVP